MSPSIMHGMTPSYAHVSVDGAERHEYGIIKNRKAASTGGGRAWSEDEEVYLLQTRLQKMPYKHIAAHLKKTELACRLHYHQLSHGSNRRKQRAASVSSASAVESPIQNGLPSPVIEHLRTPSPPIYPAAYSAQVQLPPASSLLSASSPPRPITILPKPVCAPRTVNLHLDCNTSSPHQAIDAERLRRVYDYHRSAFWQVVAADYGNGVTAAAAEDAWRNMANVASPPTPGVSPSEAKPCRMEERRARATSISALLGIDASPKSPKEREMIRRMEETGRMEVG